MKKFLFIGIILVLFQSCNQTETKTESDVSSDSLAPTTITFETPDVDLGTIYQGEIAEYVFKFTNTGSNDLKIEKVKASCGCTSPNYTKDIVKSGETGEVRITFNTAGREGKQSKSVTVTANTEPKDTKLHFVAEVVVKK